MERGMVRILLSLFACAALIACSDGRGSQYSSARASGPVPAYIPVTPGATPVSTSAAPGIRTAPSDAQLAPAPVVPAAAPAPRAGFARGQIYTACQTSGRKAASRARCGCVQWVADQELTAAQQRRGAGYFLDQHALQEVRQSSESKRSNKVFWAAWKAYGEQAARLCKNT